MLTRRGFAGLCAAAPTFGRAGLALGQSPVSVVERLTVEGRYLPQYLDLQARAAAADDGAREQLSQYASFLGDEETAIGSVARPRRPDVPIPELSGAGVADALDVIVEAAGDRQIVILNEEHNRSRHRHFAAQVLRRLRPLGFEWFAAETFAPRRPEAAPMVVDYRVGAPFLHAYGYYSDDPVFAETAREAARLGYRLADYEFRPDQYAPEGADDDTRSAYREEAEAGNLIANVLKPHPDARILVYCGYDHALEVPTRYGEWFASRLKRKTGLDPLTIEQAGCSPELKPEDDPAHVAAVQAAFAPRESVVVRQADGSIFGNPRHTGQIDLSVFHPRLPVVRGRPGWLAADPERRLVDVDVPESEGLTLLQALWRHEGPAGVPADQLLLEPGQRRATLALHPGTYMLRLEQPQGLAPAYGQITVAA